MISVTTDKLNISREDNRFSAIGHVLDELSQHLAFPSREELRIRLLTEETIGMLNAILDQYEGSIRFEGNRDEVRIYVDVWASMDSERRKTLLSVSSSGKNAAARGIMGKIGTIIANSLSDYGHNMDLTDEYTGGAVHYWRMGCDVTATEADMAVYAWSLDQYRSAVEEAKDSDTAAGEAWDELEKSIVGRLADDIVVGVRGSKVTLKITRKIHSA